MPAFDPQSLPRALKALGVVLVIGMVTSVPRLSVLRAQGGPPAGLPPQGSATAEEQLEGELEVSYLDSNNGARLVHRLHVGNQRFEMIYEDNAPPQFEHGTLVRVHGRRVTNNTLSLKSGGSVQALALPTSSTFGEQRTLVLLVNFQDNGSMPENLSSVQATTFQTVSDYYRENSYGQTWFTGDVAGYFTLPMTSGACDYNTIASLAEQAATNSGINVNAYPRRVFAFPQIGACGWWGLGNVGGNPSRAWVNGSYQMFVAAHELGHNLGNYHSHSQPCDTGGCSTVEYGDDHDIMGNIAPVDTNAFQKERLGWLNYGSSPPIQTVSSSGTYTIDPMATPGVYPKALKILKSGTTAGSRTFYYVEVRTQTGFDAAAAPGVLIHTGSESSGSTSYEIDLDPASSGFDSILDVGQQFTDSSIGLSITTTAASNAGATVDVSVNGGSAPTCVNRTPSLSFSPSASQTTMPGMTVNYNLTVLDTDDSSCAGSTFALGVTLPSGWTGGFDRASVTVTPGTSSMGVLSVTPPASAAGTSSFTSSATRSGSTGPSGSIGGALTVATLASALDVAASAMNSRGVVSMTATVTAGGSSVSGATVTFKITDPKGGVTTQSATTNSSGVATSSLRLKPKAPNGTYQVQVTAKSGGITGTASTTFVN